MTACLHLNLRKVRDQSKFDIGDVEIDETAFMNFTGHEIWTSLLRHATGDWGDALPAECRSNDLALVEGPMIVSYYKFPNEDTLVIRTWMARRLTTVARCF